MSDLAEFLLARFGEEEAGAKAATPGPWIASGDDPDYSEVTGLVRSGVRDVIVSSGWPSDPSGGACAADADHIARWDPARVLAECDAKRRIVEWHKPFRRIYGVGCDVCLQPRHLPADAPGWPCLTVRLLALPYADHPDYDESWRP